MPGNNSSKLKEWWRTQTATQRAAMVAAAHTARRGQKDSLKVRAARAATRHMRRIGIGPREVTFAKLLDAAGIKYRQQVPCGPYCIDFTVSKDLVAVEIATGSGNSRVSKGKSKRLKFLLKERHLFEVCFRSFSTREYAPLLIEKLVAFMKFVRRNPTAPREHRMVRPNGQDYTKRPYGPGNPRPISKTQIDEAALLLRQGVSAKRVWQETGIARRTVFAMARDLRS